MYTFKEYMDLTEINSEIWLKYHTLYLALNCNEKPDLGYDTPADYCDHIHKISKALNNFHLILFFQNDSCVGFMQIWIEENDSEEEICLKTDFTNLQVIQELIDDIEKIVLTACSSAKLLSLSSSTNGVEYLAQRLNLRSKHIERNYIFELKNVNRNLLQTWKSTLEAANPDNKILFFKEIPRNLLDDYCAVLTFIENEMPDEPGNLKVIVDKDEIIKDEADLKNDNEIVYSNIIINRENKIEALNRVFINQNNLKRIYQWQIGCAADHSGKGYGKWLLSTMYLKIIEEFPEIKYIIVDTHPSNLAMISLLERIGFDYYFTLKSYERVLK